MLEYDHLEFQKKYSLRDNSQKISLVNQNIPKERFIEQVKNDCKECNFYTILKYKYDTIFLNKKKGS